MKLPIDHVTFAARQLEMLTAAFTAVGIAPDYGGPHGNGVTHMASIGLPDGCYLECIAPLQPDVRSPVWHEAMAGDAGPAAWAVRDPAPLAHTIAMLRQLGVTAKDPAVRSRKRPDGVDIVWELAAVGEGTMGAFHPFRIHDHTDRSLRVVPTRVAAAAGLLGVAGVVLGVRDAPATAANMRTIYDLPAFQPLHLAGLDTPLLACPGEALMLADAADDASSEINARLEHFGPSPWIVLLTASSLQETAASCGAKVAQAPGRQDVAWLPWPHPLGGRIGLIAIAESATKYASSYPPGACGCGIP
jgi:Glyoxalase-like domain